MSKTFRFMLVVVAAHAVAGMTAVGAPQAPPSQRKHLMAVVSKGLPGATLYDADTDQEICRTTMAPASHQAAFSRDGLMPCVPVYSTPNVGQAPTSPDGLFFGAVK